MLKHVDLLGILFILYGVFQVFIALFILLIYLGIGGLMGAGGASSGDEEMLIIGGIMAGSGGLVACIVGVLAVPTLLTGVGIRRRSGWARIAGLVIGALSLTSFPFGTALGVFALIVLLDKEVGVAFKGGGAS